MFYVSKITPFFFILALFDLLVSLFIKAQTGNFIHYGQIAVFGFLLHTILGALYQIIPNSQQQKLPVEWISYIVFVLSILSSFYLYMFDLEKASFFIISSVVLTTIHFLPIIKNTKPITVKFLFISLIYMVFSSSFLIFSLKYQAFSIQIAIHTFTIGVMINAILGVQTAWIPMIYMQTLGKTKLSKAVVNSLFYIQQLVIAIILAGFYYGNYKLVGTGAILELAVLVLFLKFIVYDSIKPQYKLYKIPYQIKFFLAGHLFLVVGVLLAHIIAISSKFELIKFHIDFMVYGAGVFTILGGMVHLTPRIIWNIVHIKKAQQMKQVPNVKGVVSREKAEKGFWIVLISYFVFIVFDLMDINILATAMLGIGVFIFSLLVGKDFYKLYKL